LIGVIRTESADGYELKVTLPWAALNGAGSQLGKTIGFDVGLNDDTGGGTRETQVMLFGIPDNFNNTSQFGNLTL
jgi:Carbohydrate family 9 binding domain-like